MDKMTEIEKRALKLNDEEREILDAFEDGKLSPIDMSEREIEELKAAAAKAIDKSNRISIHIPQSDLKKIKKRAVKTGIPYQTLITAVLHQYAEGKINITI